MKRKLTLLAAMAMGLVSTNCSMTMPVNATANPVGSKVGEASGSVFLGFLAFGVDASIKSAAANGGVSKISTVDIKHDSMLGLLDTYTCIVTGE